jgi:hypothetical protein
VSLVQRALSRLRRDYARARARRADAVRPTLTLASALPLPQRFGFLDRAFVLGLARDHPGYADLLRRQAQLALEHRYNLLGSGWVTVAHGMRCAGVQGVSYEAGPRVQPDRAGDWLASRVNGANAPVARDVWRLVDADYVPIDWQLDFKSGYRWREDTWYGDVRHGHLPGVDIKVPWELARMQHLPVLALASHFAGAGIAGYRPAAAYAREFRNQVLDFVAANPPRYGVNWACPMDVAIRLANLLVARDMLVAAGAGFDAGFERIFLAAAIAHARHVAANLEWSPRERGNHYLADIAGLAFAAGFLPRGAEADAWLAFSVQELVAELEYQFHEDGSNFEASVCYHRLSAEIALWACALLAGLPEEQRRALGTYGHGAMPRLQPAPLRLHPVPGCDRTSPLPPGCWERLARMATFTEAMTKPGGLVVQFGDNDSGRFLPVASGEQLRAGNDPSSPLWSLDHGALVAGIDSLVDRGGSQPAAPRDPAGALIAGLAGLNGRARVPHAYPLPPSSCGDEAPWHDALERFRATREASRWSCVFPSVSGDLLQGLTTRACTGMGCYVFRSAALYLAVRCGEVGLAGLGAHAHCDQLAIELVLDGKEITRDPGTYLYTAFPDRRNAYRSSAAHHVPRVPGREPADLGRGPFDLRGAAPGVCLYFGPRGFVGRHAGYGPWVYRVVALESGRVVVRDFAEGGLRLGDPAPAGLPFSPGYGWAIPDGGVAP